MKNKSIRRTLAAVLIPASAIILLAGCGANGSAADSSNAEEKNSFHNASFSLEAEPVAYEEATFNGITFEVPNEWRTAEENGDALYYPSDDNSDVIRVHADSADREYENQQQLVNAMYEELMKERIEAGCFIETQDLNIAGHRGKWFRSDVNFIGEDAQPVAGYDLDESMNGYLRECVIFAADKQNYVFLEAIYPMGSITEDLFQVFYKSPHYHR